MKWHVLIFFIAMMAVAFGQTQTASFCRPDNSTLVMNETYSVCGGSPVLNPNGSFCRTYSVQREEICAYGCSNLTGMCAPSPSATALILLGIIVIVAIVIMLIWRFS